MFAAINWEIVILALIAGFPAMIAAIVNLIITLRGQTQLKAVVVEEGTKTAAVAQEVKQKAELTALEVKTTLQDASHRRDLVAQEQSHKLDALSTTLDVTKSYVNGNMDKLIQANADVMLKVTDLVKSQPPPTIQPAQPQEVRITSDSEITLVDPVVKTEKGTS